MDLFDFNGDAHLDLVATGYSNEELYYYPGNGNGTFNSSPSNPIGVAVGLNRMGISSPLINSPQPTTDSTSETRTESSLKSRVLNVGTTIVKSYTYIAVEYYNTTTSKWNLVQRIVDDPNNGTPNSDIGNNGLINLQTEFSDAGNWNTTSSTYGWYKVIFSLRSQQI